MSSFEFIFTLFGLVMGLALTEVLGGFARAVKRHGPAKLGLLTPAISLFMLYEITDFWMDAWEVRDAVPIGMPTLLVSVVITGLYYFAAVLVWPEEGDAAWDDLDGWMLEHKRQLLLSVFASNVVSVASLSTMGHSGFTPTPFAIGWMALYFGLLLAAAFVPGRRFTLTALALVLSMYATALAIRITGG
ncbi:hypothetical protein [Sphingomonas sp. LT1P40]|uniref:hypothetical protein n=1 Tax=Alteristakelama amylovorans TaxID=3096166 RepID=UPI002FCA8981